MGWVESVVLWWGNGKGDDGGGGVKKVYFRCELGWECDVVVGVGLGVWCDGCGGGGCKKSVF